MKHPPPLSQTMATPMFQFFYPKLRDHPCGFLLTEYIKASANPVSSGFRVYAESSNFLPIPPPSQHRCFLPSLLLTSLLPTITSHFFSSVLIKLLLFLPNWLLCFGSSYPSTRTNILILQPEVALKYKTGHTSSQFLPLCELSNSIRI